MKRYLGILLLITGIVVGITTPTLNPPSADAQSGQIFGGIDIVFAVDVSGSMYSTISNRSNLLDEDVAMRYIFDNAGGEFEMVPTDPSNSRFETVSFMSLWLQEFARRQESLGADFDVNYSLVTFDHTAEVATDWINLNTYDPSIVENDNTLEYSPPTNQPEVSSSDFINLYEAVAEQFNNVPEAQELPHKQVLFLITDSVPCNHEFDAPVRGSDGTNVRETACASAAPMENHLKIVNLDPTGSLNSVEQFGYFIIPTTSDKSNFTTVRDEAFSRFNDEWELVLEAPPVYMAGAEELPNALFRELVLQAADVLGQTAGTPQETFARVGLIPVSGTLSVPPYLNSMEVLLFTDPNEAVGLPQFELDSSEILPDDTSLSAGEGLLNRLTFAQPSPGDWALRTGAENLSVWVSFFRAESQLELVATSGAAQQFGSLAVQYSVVDNNGEPLPIEDDYPLNFDLVLTTPDGDELSVTEMDIRNNAYTATFVSLLTGEYRVEGSVTSDESWEVPTVNYSFLSPRNTSTLTVESVDWVTQVGTEEQQAQIEEDELPISRRDPLVVTLQSQLNGQLVNIPDGISATLNFNTPDGATNACPENATVPFELNQVDTLETSEIIFPVAGTCVLSVSIEVISQLPPLNGGNAIVLDERALGRIVVSSTSRLDTQVVVADGSPVTLAGANEDEQDYEYQMQDFVFEVPPASIEPAASLPNEWITWENDTLTIELFFVDEDGTPTDPVFEQSQVQNTTDEDALDDVLVPFLVNITSGDSEENLAEVNDISVRKGAQQGYYLLSISGLEAGTYPLEIILDTELYDLTNDFEYAASILDLKTPGVEPTFRARLIVEENSTVVLASQLFTGGLGLLILLIIVVIVRGILRRVSPLSGDIYIYRYEVESGKYTQILHEELPTNRNSHQVESSKLPHFAPPISEMTIKSQRRADKSVRVSLIVSNGRLEQDVAGQVSREQLEPVWEEDGGKVLYYVMKDSPIESLS